VRPLHRNMLAINYLSPGMDERNASLSALLPHPFFGFIDSKGHSRFVLRISILAVSLGALAKGSLVGWRIHRGSCDVCDDGANHMHGNPASAGLGLRLRQNNQNSQNEPGMSFGINETEKREWKGGCLKAEFRSSILGAKPFIANMLPNSPRSDCLYHIAGKRLSPTNAENLREFPGGKAAKRLGILEEQEPDQLRQGPGQALAARGMT